MVAPTQLQVSSHRSLHDVVYRLIDTAMILSTTYLAMSYSPHLELANLLVVAAATLIVFMFATEVSGLYRSWRSARLSAEAWCVAISWIYTAPVVLGVGMLTQYNAEFNYLTKVFWLLATPLAVAVARLAFRTFLRALRRRGINTQRFAICGANKLGVQLAQNVRQSPELGMALAGYFDDRSEGRTQQESGSVPQHVGNLDRLVELARSGEIGTIFITFPMRAEDRIRTVLDQLSDTTASVYIVPDFFVFEMLHARWNQINGLPVVSIFETPIIGIDGMLKRGLRLRGRLVASGAAGRTDDGDRPVGKTLFPRAGLLPPEAVWSVGRGDRRPEVPQHALLRQRPDGPPGHERRRPHHADRADPSQDVARRAAATVQRHRRQHVARRPAAPCQCPQRAIPLADRRLHAPAQSEAGHHGPRAGERLAWRDRDARKDGTPRRVRSPLTSANGRSGWTCASCCKRLESFSSARMRIEQSGMFQKQPGALGATAGLSSSASSDEFHCWASQQWHPKIWL